MKRNLFLLLVSFLFLGSVHAQDHFTPIESDQGSMGLNVWAEVQIDGVKQTSSNIEIGMFLDDVCKASVRVKGWYNDNFFLAKPFCVYDGANQTITFKLYNHDIDEEMDCDYSSTTTGSDMTLGANAQNPIVLNFVHETTPTYDITVTANPAEGGSVSGDGTFEAGTSVTVTATPAEGYTFVNWTENGSEVSTQASYTFTVAANRTLVANFESVSTEPDYPWVVVDATGGASNAVCMAIVQINGELITDGTNWEVGAFAGDICRGLGNIENGWIEMPEGAGVPYTYYMFMMLHGNNGEEISFKLANTETGEVHPGVCELTITYQHDGEFGDPWEPIVLNFITDQTFYKDITGYTAGTKDHFYLIASPIGEVNPMNVGHMLENSYDLYRFNQSPTEVIQGIGLEWENYKNQSYNLEVGKGYLYANSQTITLTFTGRPYSGTGEFPLDYDERASFAGWNLVGNPFAETAYIDLPFYVMNEDGSEIQPAEEGATEIAAMEGVFVIATDENQSVTFSTQPTKAQESIALNLSRNRGIIDRAFIRFDEGNMLPKFMLNQDNTKLYIPQDNDNYAIVRSTSQGEMPVNFKAAENGTYTLSINTENVQMNYLHLIDNMTGADVNLLETPSYSFNALTTDYASRFKLVFATGLSEDNFAFFSNGQWIISNEGKAILQVIDVNGRILSNEQINGSCSKQIEAAPGIYMLRLIKGNDVKVQKVVVK